MNYSRRDFGRVALAALPAAAAFAAPKINSKFGGVQVGAITYSFGGMNLDEVIKAYVDIGLGEMELMSGTAEAAAGAPAAAGGRGAGGGGGGRRRTWARAGRGSGGPGAAPAAGATRPIRPPMTEGRSPRRAPPRAQEMLKWRTSVSMDKFKRS
jgi:hypothetical protein